MPWDFFPTLARGVAFAARSADGVRPGGHRDRPAGFHRTS